MKTATMTLTTISMILCLVTPTFAQHTFSFRWDNPYDREGWTCTTAADGYTGILTGGDPGASVTWDPLSGGCLHLHDPAVQAPDFFIAPSEIMGNWYTGYTSGSITFDYKKSHPVSRVPEIWIASGTDRWAAYTVFPSYADTEWHTYSVSLDETDWVHVDTGNPTTWAEVLMNVTEFGILGDLKIGVENSYLDNVTITLHPVATEATLNIDPDTVNLASMGKLITCYITLPEPYAVEDVDPDLILLNELIAPAWSMINEEEQILMLKFDRAQVQEMLIPGEAQLMITGLLTGDILFEAFDTIYVIDPTN